MALFLLFILGYKASELRIGKAFNKSEVDPVKQRFGIIQVIAGGMLVWAFFGMIYGSQMEQPFLFNHGKLSFWTNMALMFAVVAQSAEISILKNQIKTGQAYKLGEYRRYSLALALGAILCGITLVAGVIS